MAEQAGTEKTAPGAPEGEKGTSDPKEPEAKATEAKAEDGAAKAVERDAPKSKKAPAEPPSEDAINTPDWKTLTMLVALFAVTAGSWGAARFSCNMHPPESKPPPKLTTDRLAADPKDAAIEFIQRTRSNDYDGALELALRDARTDLETARAQCLKTAAECARKREAMAGLLTTAVVERQDPSTADAVATTYFKGEKKSFKVRLARDGAVWKAVAYNAE